MQNGEKLHIHKPIDYFLKKILPGKTDQPIVEVLADNISLAQEQGRIQMSKQAVETVVQTLQQDPTPERPNPVDAALTAIDLPLVELFQGVELNEIMVVPTMGGMVKSIVVDRLVY